MFVLRLVDKLILLGKRTLVFREVTENCVCLFFCCVCKGNSYAEKKAQQLYEQTSGWQFIKVSLSLNSLLNHTLLFTGRFKKITEA